MSPYQIIDQQDWSRKKHFDFFSKFEEPFFGISFEVDVTKAYGNAKKHQISFFLFYLYRMMKAANEIENFRYRIQENEVICFENIGVSPTLMRDDNTFGFAYIPYEKNAWEFYLKANSVGEKAKKSKDFIPAQSGENIIHVSVIPWLEFTALSHARSYSGNDSCPKITFGKTHFKETQMKMPVSIHAHHGLMDAYHIGLFMEKFQTYLNEPYSN